MREFRRRRRLWRDKAGGEEKNHIKRRVERQKVFSSPPAINQSVFSTEPDYLSALSTSISKSSMMTSVFLSALIKGRIVSQI